MVVKSLAARWIGTLTLALLLFILAAPSAKAQSRFTPDEIEILVRQGTPADLEALRTLLLNGDEMERYFAAQGLGSFASPLAVDVLLEAYPREQQSQVASQILISLGQQRSPKAIPVLTEAIRLSGQRTPAAKGLLASGDRSVLPYLQGLVTSNDFGERGFALDTLGKFNAEGLDQILLDRLDKETHPYVFHKICTQAENRMLTTTVPKLIQISQAAGQLQAKRLAAIRAMGVINGAGVEETLVNLLDDSAPEVRSAAAVALENVAPSRQGKSWNPPVIRKIERDNYKTRLSWDKTPKAAGYLVTISSLPPKVSRGNVAVNGLVQRTRFVTEENLSFETGDGEYYTTVHAIVPDAVKRHPLLVGLTAGLIGEGHAKSFEVGLSHDMREMLGSLPGMPAPAAPRAAAIDAPKTSVKSVPIAALLANPDKYLGQIVLLRAKSGRRDEKDASKSPFALMMRNDGCLNDGTGTIPVALSGGPIQSGDVVVGQVQKTHAGDYTLVVITRYAE